MPLPAPAPGCVLLVQPADVKRLCAIGAADTSQDAAITALLAAQQPAQEWAIDAGILGRAVAAVVAPPAPDNPGLLATLTLGVSEVMAGSFLLGLGRALHPSEPLPLVSLNVQAAAVLTVGTADLKRLLAITDTSQDAALVAQISAEQLSLEYAIDPAVLAAAVSVSTPNAGLKALLTLGLAEQIAGHYLSQSGRVPGLGDDLVLGSLHFTTSKSASPDKLGAELSAQGAARLLPFSRHVRAEHAVKPIFNQPDLVTLGGALVKQGRERLGPFLRGERALTGAAVGVSVGVVPDDDAQVAQITADGTRESSVFDPVFVETFGEDGRFEDGDGQAEGEGIILWGGPEP